MIDMLNKKHFLTFSNQCKGARVTAIDVFRADHKAEVRLTYRARDARTGKVFQGEWTFAKTTPEADASAEGAFYAHAEKSFAVTKR